MKRGLLAFLLIFMYEYPFLQLILLMSISIIYIIYMFKVKPFIDEEQNRAEITNELFIISVIQFLMCFSQTTLIYDENKQFLGSVCCFVLVSNILYNMRMLIHQMLTKSIPNTIRRLY
jgi:hypothetical protein